MDFDIRHPFDGVEDGHMMPKGSRPVFVAVTGAQGVGKSTFCRRLVDELRDKHLINLSLQSGLGDSVRAKGVPVGASSTSETIFAIFHEHLRRERMADALLVVLDRCIVDALAYTRVLNLTTAEQLLALEEIACLAATRLDLVIELQISAAFANTTATHETPEMRAEVALKIPAIIAELGLRSIVLDASQPTAIEAAVAEITKRVR